MNHNDEHRKSAGGRRVFFGVLVFLVGVCVIGAYASFTIMVLAGQPLEPIYFYAPLLWTACFFYALWKYRGRKGWHGAASGVLVWLFVILVILPIAKDAVLPSQVEKYLLSQEIIQAIRDANPEAYAAILADAERLAARGATLSDVVTEVRPSVLNVATKYIAVAPDDLLLPFVQASLENQRMVGANDGELCYLMMMGQGDIAKIANYVPKNALEMEQNLLAKLVRGTSIRPQAAPTRESLAEVGQQIRETMSDRFAYTEQDWAAINAPDTDRATVCRFFLDLHEVIFSLSPSESGDMIRFMQSAGS